MDWVNRFVRLLWLAVASLAIALVCVCGAIRLAAQGNEQGAGNAGDGLGVGVLRGAVVNGVTHEPIGRVVVSSADHRFAVMTDERGRFEMVFKKKPDANGAVANAPNGPRGVRWFPMPMMAPDGTVLQSSAPAMVWDRPDYLTARKIGFLFEMEGGTPGVSLTRDQSEVILTMMPEARVIGHVTLAGGEGALGMQISLYMRTVQAGRMRWISVGQVRARSDGEFRFAELGAGSYKLFSQELMDADPLTADPRGQLYGYPPQYYPAAADFASAAVIRLAAGETFQASLTPERRKYYPVRIGFASGVAGGIIPEVEVSREGHKGPGYSLGYDFRDGSIGGTLPDGNYSLKLSTQLGGGLTGITNIAVNGGPAVGGVVTMVPGSSIRVRVNAEFSHAQEGGQVTVTDGFRPEGDQNAQRPQYVQVSLVPVEEFDNQQEYPGPPPPPASEDDDLVVANVPPGKYRVAAHESQFGYVSSMRCGDMDVQHSILEVGPGVTMPPIEITMRDDGAEVSGTVPDVANRNRGSAESTTWQPSPGVVYFVPVHEGVEMKQAWVEPNGNFQLPQLAPGSYRVLAFAQAKPFLEFTNEETMARYGAPVITLAPGQKEHLQVSLLEEQ